ncbi:hypothetical protein [Xylella fastidiosa]|nr:hypothetical protein [Xylella fastidiosa]
MSRRSIGKVQEQPQKQPSASPIPDRAVITMLHTMWCGCAADA